MTPADQLAHFSGGTDDLAMTGLWYSHKRVAELVAAARQEGAAGVRARVEAVLADEWRDEKPSHMYPEGRRLYRWPGDLRAELRAALEEGR